MNVQAIKTPAAHKEALARIDKLMTAEAGTPEARELEVLAILVQAYEATAFPLRAPTPREAIQFRMEQGGHSPADLARVLGSRSRASEIINGKVKQLPLNQIRRLVDA